MDETKSLHNLINTFYFFFKYNRNHKRRGFTPLNKKITIFKGGGPEPRRWRSGKDRWPHKRTVGCSNDGRDRLKS